MDLALVADATGRARQFSGPTSLSRGGTKVAFVVPASAGWLVYPLGTDPDEVQLYDRPLQAGRPLAAGDVLRVGTTELTVGPGASPRTAPPTPPAELRPVGGRWVPAADGLLVGSARHCMVRLPDEPEVAPVHALLVASGANWRLFDVSGRGIVAGDQALNSVTLGDGVRVRLGPAAVEVRGGGSVGGAVPPAVSDTRTEATALAATSAGEGAEPDPVYVEARKLCRRMQRDLRGVSSGEARKPGSGSWSLSRLVPTPSDPMRAAAWLGERLRVPPYDTADLRRLSAFLEQQGYLDLRRFVLREICRIDPDDFVSALEAARLSLEMGLEAHRPTAERLDALDRALAFAERAVALRPGDRAALELITEIGAERTLVRAGSSAGPGGAGR
jgi:hypothetical protein